LALKKKALQIANENSRLYAKGYVFRASEDKVEGYICRKQEFPQAIKMADLAEILKINGIQYGISEPARLAEDLAQNPKPKSPWAIAKGKPAVPDEKAKLVYHFNTDPLRIGTLKETGFMDYKDRGKIPQVKAGTVVAEKIPGKKGTAGIDIYGQPIPPPKAPDVKLQSGKGVTLSEDGLKAIANTDGRPVKSADGKAHVFADFIIKGDIGIRTGHVDFEGHIEVEGIVNAGYRVKGGSLCTQEINNANCDIVGNINVLGGANGASLKAGGNLRARYIHKSTIEAMGDVIVDRDVSNSTIISGGTVIVDNGKILTSKVQAKNGITAVGIGSKSSETCDLIVGIDSRIDAALGEINEQIAEKVAHKNGLESSFNQLAERSGRLEQTIANAAEVQTGTQNQLVLLVKMLKSLPPGKNNDAWKIKSKINMLRSTSGRSLATITKLREDLQLVFEDMENLREQIRSDEKAIARLEDEIYQLDERSQIKDGVFERNPIVQSIGTIHAGTSIKGPHASLVIREDNRHVKILEIKLEKKDTPKPWRMVVKRM
jgi:uncharacterized protein (DUF342 family)